MNWKVPTIEPCWVSGAGGPPSAVRFMVGVEGVSGLVRLKVWAPEQTCRGFGQAEVQQLGAGGGQHDIAGLEIAVHNAGAVSFLQRIANLYAALQRLLQWKRPLLQAEVQALALDVLHHQVVGSILASHIMQHANVGMIERGNRACFPLEALLGLEVGRKMRRQDFDRYSALQAGVASAIHFAHAARAQRRLNFIGPEFRA